MPTMTYAFDPTGTLPANKIINEPQAVTVSNAINAYLIVPNVTPFYGSSLIMVNSSGQTLIENVDYYLTHPWKQGSDNTGFPVYGSITLITGYKVDLYKLNYQTIGGEYVITRANTIVSGIIAASSEFITLDWSTAPAVFPSIPHTEMLSGINGMTQVYQAINNITSALNSPFNGLHYKDIVDMSEMYVLTSLSPTLDLINSIGLNNNAESTLISEILDNQYATAQGVVLPSNLNHYTIPIGMGLQLKVGQYFINYGVIPTFINFVTPPFNTFCMFVGLNLTFNGNNNVNAIDAIAQGKPTANGVPVTITLSPSNTTNVRLLTYFAIGM